MRKFSLAVLVVVLSLSAYRVVVFAFDSPEGGFSVKMPGKPLFQQIHHKSFVGDVKENTYTLKTKTEEYSVSYTQLPGIATTFESDQALFNKAKDGFVKDTGADEVSYGKFPFNGKQGRELVFKIDATDKSEVTTGKARFFLFDKILYVVTASTTRGVKGGAVVDQFLDSFKLMPHS
ncbi:MAG: hypothetical protein U1F57_09590 [bacterium]